MVYSHEVSPIAGVEVEFSLFATDILHNDIASTAANLKIPIIAYSPLGRGILTGSFSSLSQVPQGDFLHFLPKYQDNALQQNIKRVKALESLAAKNKLTITHLALGWVRSVSTVKPGLPTIIPIPGGTTPDKIEQNLKAPLLSKEIIDEIDRILEENQVVGTRY